MRSVHSKNTGPELMVRRMLHGIGYRYRLHRKSLPGSPDLVFPSRRKVIFVHGCFWHGHDCRYGQLPKSRLGYWKAKIEQNRRRDARNRSELKKMGWKSIVVWQCQLKNPDKLLARLVRNLEARE